MTVKVCNLSVAQNGGDASQPHDNTPYRGGKGTLFEGGARTVSMINSPLLENLDDNEIMDGYDTLDTPFHGLFPNRHHHEQKCQPQTK